MPTKKRPGMVQTKTPMKGSKGIADGCATSLPLHTQRQSAAGDPVEVLRVRVE